jgi:methionyl aminopeptidase
MEKEIIEKYKKAGAIAAKAKDIARAELKEGIRYIDLCKKVDDYILKSGAQFAFPINISVNDIAAHDTGIIGDERVFKISDLVKIDIGVSIDGYIADTAFTKEIGTNNYEKLIEASRMALDNVIKEVKPGIKVSYLGGIIEETIKDHGFTPIINLSGHVVEKYVLHSGVIVPNFDNGSNVKLEYGQAVAIEPFATTGEGFVISGKDSDIYRFITMKPVRTGRNLLKDIEQRFNTLPFAGRWMKASQLELKRLVSAGAIHNYEVLRERSKGVVSQAEDTVIVLEEPIVTTK